ncbi:hypothetical protein HDV03_004791 [Kappamyces sp. JEL0829]|nr:hypothetical protein HDV03_004791 [Kappamyces sp. JEL0829]
MKIAHLAASLFAVHSVLAQSLKDLDCQQRKEWRQLTKTEQQRYLAAVKKLYEQPALGDVDNPDTWSHRMFGKIHANFYAPNHSDPNKPNDFGLGFFTWHRLFIQAYERRLQSFDASIVLPYWDWTQDSQSLLSSDILHSDFFGSAIDDNNCLVDGVAGGWVDHTGSCLQRFPMATTAFAYSSEVIATQINKAATFRDLQLKVESTAHPMVHEIVGGAKGQFGNSLSAHEPLFFLHHAMVDKVWHEWQACPDHFANFAATAANVQLPPFKVDVRATFSTVDNGALCYTYSDSGINRFINMPCPSTWLENSFRNLLPSANSLIRRDAGSNNSAAAVDPLLLKLKYPSPVPDHVIAMRGLNETHVRWEEANTKALIDEINARPDYVSPCAMVNFGKYNKKWTV